MNRQSITSLLSLLRSDGRFSPALRRLCEPASEEVFLVGGCVRDALLGRPIADIDLVLAGSAIASARVFARAVRGAFVLLDAEEGVGRVVVRRRLTFDFSPLKGATIGEDLAQRDFTINAIACRLLDALDGTPALIDPFHGVDDLRRKRLVAVSEQAFVHDPLRLLRAFRFAGQLRFRIDPVTTRWLRQWAHLLPTVSVERVRDELALLLTEPNSTPWVKRMHAAGVLKTAMPELSAVLGPARTAFRLSVQVDALLAAPDQVPLAALRLPLVQYLDGSMPGGRRRSWLLRFAALLIGDHPALPRTDAWIEQTATERLRLSTHERQALARLVRLPAAVLSLQDQAAGLDEALYTLTRDAKDDTAGVALLALAESRMMGMEAQSCVPLLNRLLWLDTRRRTLHASPRLVTGDDLMAVFHLPPGPRVGTLLSRLEESQAIGHIRSRDEAFAAVRAWLAHPEGTT